VRPLRLAVHLQVCEGRNELLALAEVHPGHEGEEQEAGEAADLL
jgi:hypothetical protein